MLVDFGEKAMLRGHSSRWHNQRGSLGNSGVALGIFDSYPFVRI
jgi:hypothetical protein